MIELIGISKAFQDHLTTVHAVKDVSVSIEEGDILGIVGSSGAGKSTVLNCINLLEKPDKGEVWVDGTNLTALKEKELEEKRKEIGMIFQNFELFSQRTVLENVIYPIKGSPMGRKAVRERGKELLKLVGIPDKENAYPNQLSGGQKQRVAIARALSSNPKILLCDEATSALDPETTNAILRLLQDINKRLHITIVLITHEKAVVKQICNRVVLMEDGEVVEQGNTVAFFTNPITEAGKTFVSNELESQGDKEQILAYLKKSAGKERVYQLTFLGEDAHQPFVSDASKHFGVNIAILYGNIELINEEIVGNLIVTISGDTQDEEKVLAFFNQNNIITRRVSVHE
ncbi:MAG: ATP-binding cassette domain-containing protein [Clostridiales bacterium]|nr:ATP-binding cassette domain-containing protein [Clostridiales bacterium]